MNKQKILLATGEILQTERKKQKIKQIDLAKKIGCSTSGLSKIETGTVEMKYCTFIEICENLKLDPSKVLKQAVEMSPTSLKCFKKIESMLPDKNSKIDLNTLIDFNTL
ncbi:MAG: helix-turn-helix transcriptional regulator [Alphaproteobacteria bacterium]|nr:helix-turn-helix transcriptional regulator [Alphaproteobacteria bacterium]